MTHPKCLVENCDQQAKTRGWCDKHYRRWLKHRDPQFDRKPGRPVGTRRPLLERISEKLHKAENGCWEWTGATNPQTGYGVVGSGGRGGVVLLVHRAVYELVVGSIPPNRALDHLCHNRSENCPGGSACAHRRCANPAHLAVVTHAENAYSAPVTREQRQEWGREGARRRWG